MGGWVGVSGEYPTIREIIKRSVNSYIIIYRLLTSNLSFSHNVFYSYTIALFDPHGYTHLQMLENRQGYHLINTGLKIEMSFLRQLT